MARVAWPTNTRGAEEWRVVRQGTRSSLPSRFREFCSQNLRTRANWLRCDRRRTSGKSSKRKSSKKADKQPICHATILDNTHYRFHLFASSSSTPDTRVHQRNSRSMFFEPVPFPTPPSFEILRERSRSVNWRF